MGKRKTDDFIASDEENDEYISDESKESVESTEAKPKSRKVCPALALQIVS